MNRITVVVANRPGVVADVCGVLGEGGINIGDLGVEVVSDVGVINLTVEGDYDLALSLLRDAGFQAVSEKCIVVRVKDEPGAIARIAARFKASEINLNSLHIIGRQGDFVLVALAAGHSDAAVELVKDVIVSGGV